MKLGSQNEYLELQFAESIPQGRPSAGDVRVSVAISIEGFAGQYQDVWLEKPQLEAFIAQLGALDASLQGKATLNSASPDEFTLNLHALDSLGHLGAEVALQRVRYDSQGNYRPLKVSGSFEFEPNQIAQLKAECTRWLA